MHFVAAMGLIGKQTSAQWAFAQGTFAQFAGADICSGDICSVCFYSGFYT
jgi:hypothetical protein